MARAGRRWNRAAALFTLIAWTQASCSVTAEGPKLPKDELTLTARATQTAAGGDESYEVRVGLQRNGKVERYQQTLKREWGLGQVYRDSDARQAALAAWLMHYNTTRNHSSLDNRPPITRVRKQPRHNT